MVDIRKMQSRDQEALAELFSEQGSDYFEAVYLAQLQGEHLVLVASHKTEEGQRLYYGYVLLKWESGYTQFWRRNIPEIFDLNVAADHRRQGIGSALIRACEDAAREHNYSVIGIGVEQDDTHASAQQLYLKLGYEPNMGISEQNILYLQKAL